MKKIEATFIVKGATKVETRVFDAALFSRDFDIDTQVRRVLAREFEVETYETGLMMIRLAR